MSKQLLLLHGDFVTEIHNTGIISETKLREYLTLLDYEGREQYLQTFPLVLILNSFVKSGNEENLALAIAEFAKVFDINAANYTKMLKFIGKSRRGDFTIDNRAAALAEVEGIATDNLDLQVALVAEKLRMAVWMEDYEKINTFSNETRNLMAQRETEKSAITGWIPYGEL